MNRTARLFVDHALPCSIVRGHKDTICGHRSFDSIVTIKRENQLVGSHSMLTALNLTQGRITGHLAGLIIGHIHLDVATVTGGNPR